MPRSNQPRNLHVALVGTTGVGKSTLVNVLWGKEIAKVNNNARWCTEKATKYEIEEEGTRYCIWDTRGLNEASESIPTRALKWLKIIPDAERDLKKLLRGNNPKFDLVLLCIDAKKIRVSVQWKMYNLINTNICKRRLKVAVVVTQMDEEDFRGEWKRICKDTAKGVVGKFPDERLLEAVPKFDERNKAKVEECKGRILNLVSNACKKIA